MAKKSKTAPGVAEKMRLDRFLALASDLSRARVRPLIMCGAVQVDGVRVRDLAFKVSSDQEVLLSGMPVAPRGPVYLMLNKPEGVVCATTDAEHETVIDLLPEALRAGVHPAGRLDRDTTGMVLLTDDGQWSHRVTSPKHLCSKRYRVELAEPLSAAECEAAREQFSQGIMLRGETKPTLPAELIVDSSTRMQLLVTEGRYHQVKRMFAALGNKVERLHREQIGALVLDTDLEVGQYRVLSAQEIAQF
ncbi:MAG: 16S rRNA pseudouridine516 synthase [Motiliproteus sp.]|jgi:16S rRNA pseudouridine516 synthase